MFTLNDEIGRDQCFGLIGKHPQPFVEMTGGAGMKRKHLVVLLTLAGVVAATVGSANTVTAHAQGSTTGQTTASPAPTTPTVAQQVAFRESFGLPTSLDAMSAAQANPATVKTVDYGVPLTQAEQNDLEARGRIQIKADSLVAAVAAVKDLTGGIYVDQHAGGQFVIEALPGLEATTESSLRALVPSGGSIRFDPATVSTGQLEAAMSSLDVAFGTNTVGLPPATVDLSPLKAKLAAEGISVVALQIDVASNSIEFGLETPPADATTLVRAAWDKYAASLLPSTSVETASAAVSRSADARYSKPGQLMAGLDIVDQNYGNSCTSNIDATDSSGRLYMITAGHCSVGVSGNPSGIGQSFGAGCDPGITYCSGAPNHTIGQVALSSFNPNQAIVSDSEAIALSPGGYASPYLYSQPSGDIPHAWPVPSLANPVAGGQICLDGGHTYFTLCGLITSTSWTGYVYDDADNTYIWEYNQTTTNFPAQPGDSGGPLSWGGVDYGIVSATDSSSLEFTPINEAMSYLGAATSSGAPLTPLVAPSNGIADWSLQVSRYSGQCVDVQYNNPANGTPVWQYPCNGNPAQQWTLVPSFNSSGGYFVYTIHRFANPSLCLDLNIAVGNNGMNNGTPVQEWQCNGQNNQQWRLFAEDVGEYYEVISMHSGNCLDLNIAWPGGGYSAGTPIQTWQCLGPNQTNQHWNIG